MNLVIPPGEFVCVPAHGVQAALDAQTSPVSNLTAVLGISGGLYLLQVELIVSRFVLMRLRVPVTSCNTAAR